MHLLTAVFNEENLSSVLQDLSDNGIEGVTVSGVQGRGCYKLLPREDQDPTHLQTKVKIDLLVTSGNTLEIAQECIRSNCMDFEHGSGKMWWIPIAGIERIRTGERDEDALTSKEEMRTNMPSDISTSIDTPCS